MRTNDEIAKSDGFVGSIQSGQQQLRWRRNQKPGATASASATTTTLTIKGIPQYNFSQHSLDYASSRTYSNCCKIPRTIYITTNTLVKNGEDNPANNKSGTKRLHSELSSDDDESLDNLSQITTGTDGNSVVRMDDLKQFMDEFIDKISKTIDEVIDEVRRSIRSNRG